MPKIFYENRTDSANPEELKSALDIALKKGHGVALVITAASAVCSCGKPDCKDGGTSEAFVRNMTTRDIALAAHTIGDMDPSVKTMLLGFLFGGVTRAKTTKAN